MMQVPAPYEYSRGYIIQRLGTNDALPPHLLLGGIDYIAKPELHCSLIAIKKLVPRLAEHEHLTEEVAEEKALTAAISALAQTRPTFKAYQPNVRIASQPGRDRQTVIIMAEVTNIEQTFSLLGKALDLEIPTQPTHVTIYTLENGLPIGVTSPSELAEITRALTASETDQLRQQINLQQVFGVTQ
jgi:hypothetical protein